MEKKKIGNDVSSGAEKVEAIEKQSREEAANQNRRATAKKPAAKKSATAKAAKKKAAVKKSSPDQSAKTTLKKAEKRADKKAEKESAAAEKRIRAAQAKAAKKEKKLMKKAELKQKKLEKKAAIKEKKLAHKAQIAAKKAERKAKADERRAALKEKKAERRAEKIARREMLKNESKADKRRRLEREKKERLALKRQKQEAQDKAREQKLKAREAAHARKAEKSKHKREQKTERRKHAPGFGGWLAATISLGVACLALATVVTAGYFRMNDMTLSAQNGFRSTLYEMVSVSEDMDDNLGKLRVSSGANEQRKLLTEVLVDSALLESAIERCPVDAATGTDISAFVNKTNAYARTLLAKIAAGKTLTQTERNTISYLYNVNTALHKELNDLANHMTEKDMMMFLEGKEGSVSQKFGEIGQGTHAEPEETVDAPFSGEGNVGDNKLSSQEEVTSARAEELVKTYLNNYHIRSVCYTGETVARDMQCYNFVLTDENEIEIFAQITKKGGKLAFFDTYEACTQKNFDLETSDKLAREFLAGLGIYNVDAVWLSDAGMVADITYVSNDGGVRAYPDMIRVRVCESRGRVVGLDASGYHLNYGERSYKTELSQAEAQAMLARGLEANAAHLALIPVDGLETLAYEFECSYGEDSYIVYIDANTGDEVQVYYVRESAQGRYLR